MALVSPGVEVTITDESQYAPAGEGSVPLVIFATAQNKADPTSTRVAQGTTAANAGKLYLVTSQRDLVSIYGNPFFYTTTNGTPIQGYELNEYGLLAAYSALGISNRCYCLRADIDLASLVGQTGRPVGFPADGTQWLDTTASTWGIFEFNQVTSQFSIKTPIVITDSTFVVSGAPVSTLGAVGDYAVIAIEPTSSPTTSKQFFYKNRNGAWVSIGSRDWMRSWPTIQGATASPTLTPGDTFDINMDGDFQATITVNTANVSSVVDAINNLGWSFLSASAIDGKLVVYSSQLGGDYNSPPKYLNIITGTGTVLEDLGITPGLYFQPQMAYGTSAEQPLWQASQVSPAPTGSVWIKVGAAGNGAQPVLSTWNNTTKLWVNESVTLAQSPWEANATLDSSGGKAIPVGTVYGQYNYYGDYNNGPIYLYQKRATGPTVIVGQIENPTFTEGPYTFTVQVSIPGSSTLSNTYTVSLADGATASDFCTAWSSAGIPLTSAYLNDNGSIVLVHTEGGDILVNDYLISGPDAGKSSGLLASAGLFGAQGWVLGPSNVAQFQAAQAGTTGVGVDGVLNVITSYRTYYVSPTSFPNTGSGYTVGDNITISGAVLGGTSPANDLVVKVTQVGVGGTLAGVTYVSGIAPSAYTTVFSNWELVSYTANEGAPVSTPADGTNWFFSVTDQVDIMINYNGAWKGYKNVNYDVNGFPQPTGTNATDPNGPIMSASEPTRQSDNSPLVYGDLWIDTNDLENYPVIYRWQAVNGIDKWVLIDNTDQVSASGIVFADARWATNGTTNPADDPVPSITSLLTSNYLDVDAPSASLYPTGTLLFNTRRSGYNVKQYRVNYFNLENFPGQALPTEKDAWVSVSGLQFNGAPYMGRKAQRAMVVQALKATLDTNQAVRDEDNFFNLIAAPNYPELQPSMIVLNADRGDTGYILGDTPMRLAENATDLQAWATNAAGATSTGEQGLVTRNTYMGLFYPSGLANDLNGNLVAVPASHMMLRTFLRNDNIAYPWLAAAGTRRGIIENAASIGYLDAATGEFVTTKTRLGIRDILYTNFINPLVFFTGNGLLNYGNKTSFNSQSALDRTNVARLVCYLRRALTISARPFVFEPNDQLTRQQIKGVVESIMLDLVAKRGVYDYLVVCDDSNNTPARIDRNELWVDVAIEPVKAAEFIYIPVRILNTGELGGA